MRGVSISVGLQRYDTYFPPIRYDSLHHICNTMPWGNTIQYFDKRFGNLEKVDIHFTNILLFQDPCLLVLTPDLGESLSVLGWVWPSVGHVAAAARGRLVSVPTEMSGDTLTTSAAVLMEGTRQSALVQTEITFRFKIRVKLVYSPGPGL